VLARKTLLEHDEYAEPGLCDLIVQGSVACTFPRITILLPLTRLPQWDFGVGPLTTRVFVGYPVSPLFRLPSPTAVPCLLYSSKIRCPVGILSFDLQNAPCLSFPATKPATRSTALQ
jgi:hypothetical protein